MTVDVKIIEWVSMVLKEPIVNVTTIAETPWSNILKINIGNEFVYLKHTPELIASEAKIIQLLRDQFHAPVATVIAHNPELNCFLMKDAGRSLRSILKKRFDTGLLCRAIDQFTSLQIAVADHVNVFLNIGVPDWRLNKLPDLYKEAILQKDLLIADGLSEVEVNKLEALLPKITYFCQKLATYSIKQTIVQPDFNDNNTLIDDKSQAITIIDLGEIAISHPFFSLLNCLHVIKKHYALTNEDDTYLKIKDACLKNYMKFESEKNVLNAFEIAHVLWFAYGLLAHDRLIQACGFEQLMSFQHGKLSEMLKEFIAVCTAADRNNNLQQ
jgi:Phosphotransferase enzyme family